MPHRVRGDPRPVIVVVLALGPEPWERGQAEIRVSCRRNLMRLAEKGNPAAAIFLGRTVLKLVEPPRETRQEIDAHVSGTVNVWKAYWGGPRKRLSAKRFGGIGRVIRDS